MPINRIDGKTPPPPQPTSAGDTCQNCGVIIGRLETPHIYQNFVVCSPCYGRLAGSTNPLPPALVNPHCCPQCNSSDTVTLRAVYERGASQWSGATVGIAGDGLFVGGSEGTSVSRSASRAAPPRRKDIFTHVLGLGVTIAIIVGGIAAIWSAVKPAYYNPAVKPDDPSPLIPFGCILIVGGFIWAWITVVSIRRDERWNTREYPALIGRWRRGWMCQRCGTIFQGSP